MVRLFKSGRTGNYYAHYHSSGGHRRQFSCRTTNRRQAEIFAAQKYEELKKQTAQLAAPPSYSLREFADLYLHRLAGNLSPNTVNTYRDSFSQLFKRVDETMILGELDVSACYGFVYSDQPSTQTAARHYRQLRRAFQIAQKWGLVEDNPFLHFDCPRPIQRKKDTLDEAEFKTLIEALPMTTFSQRRFKRMLIVGVLTGLRESELLHLNIDDLKFDENMILIRNTKTFRTKSGKNRFVPMSSTTKAVLEEQIREKREHDSNMVRTSTIVFSNLKGKPISLFTMSEEFRIHARKVFPQKDNLCFHSLRGSFITAAIEEGVPVSQIQVAVGHSNIVTTQSYINYDKVKTAQLAEHLEKRMIR